LVIVHGGGEQLKQLCARVGLEEVRHEGLRITCAETSELALGVLGGIVNRKLVQALESDAVPAVGLCGADGASYAVRKHKPDGVDLGYVGEIVSVDPRLVETLLTAGYVPVLASVAPLARMTEGDAKHIYNVNADAAAGELAVPFKASALLFMTDVPAVLDSAGNALSEIDAQLAKELKSDGTLKGGMLPKVRAAFTALNGDPEMLVKIVPSDGADAIMQALETSVGTRISPFAAAAIATPKTPSSLEAKSTEVLGG